MTDRKPQPPIPRPERWVKAVRVSESTGEEHLAHVGYINVAEPKGGRLNVKTEGAEGLLAGRALPFPPPMIEEASAPEGFEFHWRTLDYVFELPDPRDFPPLTVALDADDPEVVERFARTARDLARSGVVNAVGGGMVVNIADVTDEEDISLVLSERDQQVGFATLLRHCDSPSPKERASFQKVANILWLAAERESDEHSELRQTVLKEWRNARGRLHHKSLNQLLRDKLVAEEDMGVLGYNEPDSPNFLLSAFDYGDLVHWDSKRDVVATWEADEFTGGDRRLAFLAAASALAHIYMGYAVLAETATGLATP
jgi:hypothetical protein